MFVKYFPLQLRGPIYCTSGLFLPMLLHKLMDEMSTGPSEFVKNAYDVLGNADFATFTVISVEDLVAKMN